MQAPVVPASPRREWLCVGLVFLCFAVYGTLRTPIPGANEPNYLSKAKNFWQPDWCRRDPYLQSGNSHWFFYATCGALTKFCTLEQTAWIGRGAAWFLLAWGWVRMLTPLTRSPWNTVPMATLFLAWNAWTHTNFSGEWVIGGVEGKSFAYAGLWLATGELFSGRLKTAGFLAGLGTSFHPVVGVWAVLGASVATATLSWRDFWLPQAGIGPEVPRDNPPWPCGGRIWVLPALLLLAGALPGLIPAALVLGESLPRELMQKADEIHIFIRLKHHLDPTSFPPGAYQSYGVLLVFWLVLLKPTCGSWKMRWFARTVTVAVLVAVGGLILGWGIYYQRLWGGGTGWPWARLLKFYLFRSVDLALPLAVAVQWIIVLCPDLARAGTSAEGAAIGSGDKARTSDPAVRARALRWSKAILGVWTMLFVIGKPFPPPSVPAVVAPEFLADWKAVQTWINGNTPADALFLIPRYNRNFKWTAQRAEYHSWKDCPQDAAGILEWNRRRLWLDEWMGRHAADERITAEELRELGALTGPDRADYALLYSRYRVDQPPLYRNNTFSVFQLPAGNTR